VQGTLVVHSAGPKETTLLRHVRKILKSDHELRHAYLSARPPACLSVCLFVCSSVRPSEWSNSVPTGWILVEFDILVFFKNLSKKLSLFKISQK
jgi:hypothetical protein